MVTQFQTSFVPKKAPVMMPPMPGLGGRSVHFLAIAAIIFFCATAALAAAAFFYQSHLVRSIEKMDAALAAAKKSFEPEFIEAASRLGARIDGARELLHRHRALSPLFDILEKKTLENVRFRNFDFTAENEQSIELSMTGEARSFNAVALQSDVFGAERAFKDPVFSNFTLNESGDVVFNFTAVIDQELLRYRETVIGTDADAEDMEAFGTEAGSEDFADEGME